MGEFKEFMEQRERSKESDFAVLNMYLHKSKVEEIAQESGKSIGEIYRTLQRYNISPNRLKSKHNHVLGFAQNGFTIGEIAKLTGYTQRNVRYILSNQLNEDI